LQLIGARRYGSESTPQGVQGPIRGDMSGDRSAASNREWSFPDLQKRLGPIGGVGTF